MSADRGKGVSQEREGGGEWRVYGGMRRGRGSIYLGMAAHCHKKKELRKADTGSDVQGSESQ